jgi:hypothetical protein
MKYTGDSFPGNMNLCFLETPSLKFGELRGEGGLSIIPPSIHASGDKYEWITHPTGVYYEL